MAVAGTADEYALRELTAFQKALKKTTKIRRHRQPTHPRTVLREIMNTQGLKEEGVAEKTGLDPSEISALLKGEKRFAARTTEHFKGWLGVATADTLHTLQHTYDAFQKSGARPDLPPSEPDPRTVSYFSSLKRR